MIDKTIRFLGPSNSPEESAENIQKSGKYEISPDGYSRVRQDMPENNRVITSSSTAQVMNQSEQHKNIVKDDVEKLNWFERQSRYAGKTLEGNDISQELFSLTSKKAMGKELTRKQKFRRLQLTRELQELNGEKQDIGYSFVESIPGEFVGGLDQMAGMFNRAKYHGALGAGFGTATGVGPIAGGGAGLTMGVSLDVFEQTSGQIYHELDMIIDEKTERAEAEKRAISQAGGVITGLIATLPVTRMFKHTPFLNRLASPKAFAKYVASPQGSAMRQILTAMAGTGVAEGVEEGSQEVVQSIATEVGKTWNGDETSFIEGLQNALKMPETYKNALKAGTIGSLVGGTVGGGLSATGVIADKTVGDRVDRQGGFTEPPPPARDVTPTPPQLPGAPAKNPGDVVQSQSDISGPSGNVPMVLKGTRAIQLKTMLDISNELTTDTNTKRFLPQEMDRIRKKNFEDAGTSHVWVDKDELQQWADQDEKARAALRAIDPSGVAESEIDSPIRIEAHKFLKLAEVDPEVTNLVKMYPEGPSAKQQNDLLDRADRQKMEILEMAPEQVPILPRGMDPEMQESINKTVNSHQEAINQQQEALNLEQEKLSKTSSEEQRAEIQQRIDKFQSSINEAKTRIMDLKALTSDEELRLRDSDIFGEESYLEQPTFTEEMYEVIPANESLKMNEAHINTRVEIADAIRAEAEQKEMSDVKDIETRHKEKADAAKARGKSETSEKIDVVEDFLDGNRVIGDLTQEQQKLKEQGIPPHSIDPDSLTEELRREYSGNEKLIERKVFRKGGMHINEVASIYGVPTSEDLLDILSNTPTTEEQIQLNKQDRDFADQSVGRGDFEFNDSRLAKAYDKMSNIHLNEMKILRDKYWPVVRKGIERVALDIPSLRDRLKVRAKDKIGSTRVKDLNVNQWKVAERRAQRKAVQAVTRNRIEEAMREKQNAAYSNQLSKESHIAVGKVNRAMNWIARLNEPEQKKTLARAGGDYENAVNFILDVYNFNPSQKGQGDVDQYNKFIKESMKRGQDFEIPASVRQWLTPKTSAKEMTVDQLLWVEKYLRRIMRDARRKNQLIRKKENQNLNIVAQTLHEKALENPNYDETRISQQEGKLPNAWHLSNWVGGFESLMNNNRFIVERLDGKIKGPYYDAIHAPLVGVGEYDGPSGLTAWSKLIEQYRGRFGESIVKAYGKTRNFTKKGVEIVEVPEFSRLPHFKKSKGKVSKSQLIMMLLNMGNSSNREYFKNYGTDASVVMTVLQRELDKEDFDFAQEVWDMYGTIGPRLQAVHKNTTGEDLELIQPEAFNTPWGTYRGGYFPAFLQRTAGLREVAEQAVEDMKKYNPTTSKVIDSNLNFKPAYKGMVRDPHVQERIGSDEIFDLDIGNISKGVDTVLYDIAMREPILDVMKTLQHPEIKKDITAQVGQIKYNTLVNNVAAMTKSITAKNVALHNDTVNWIKKTTGAIDSAWTVNMIAFNLSSTLFTTLAIPQVGLKMGTKNFNKYMAQTALSVGGHLARGNMDAFRQAFELASDIDPSIRFFRAGIDDFRLSAFEKMLPKDRLVNATSYDAIKRFQESVIDFSLSGVLGGMDVALKTYVTNAVYHMYRNGDAPGHPYESVYEGKTEEEVHRAAKAYTSAFLEGTTMRALEFDKSVLQNIIFGRIVTRFMNEPRNQFNNYIQAASNIKRDAKLTKRYVKEGNYDKAAGASWDIGKKAMNVWLAMVVSNVLINSIRFGQPFLTDEEKETEDVWNKEFNLRDQINNMPKYLGEKLTPSGLGNMAVDNVFGSAAILSDIVFSKDTKRQSIVPTKPVSVPLWSAFTDIATTFNAPGLFYDQMKEGLTMAEVWDELTPQEKKALLNTAGYASGGIPGLNQWLKIQTKMEQTGESPIPDLGFSRKDFVNTVDSFLGEQKTPEELQFERLKKKASGGQVKEKEAFNDGLRKLKNKMAPKEIDSTVLTKKGYELIKHAESGGRPGLSPDTSSAQGYYQFTDATWTTVINTPEGRAAGLTEAMRFSDDPEPHEIAARIHTKMVARQYAKKEVPITLESLYFGHHFGITKARQFGEVVFNNPDSTKLPDGLLTSSIRSANPKLVTGDSRWGGTPANVKTVGDMKEFLRWNLRRGLESLKASGNL